MSELRSQTLTLLAKDLRLEWRAKARLVAVAVFGLLSLVVFSIAVGPDSKALTAGAAGFLVIALLLSSTLALAESFRIEHERRALEGILLLPVRPGAIFYSKAIANTLSLALLAPERELYVLELSSFQLERAQRLGLSVATVLNVSADHLDRHGTMPSYRAAKHRIFDGCNNAVVNPDDALTVPLLSAAGQIEMLK